MSQNIQKILIRKKIKKERELLDEKTWEEKSLIIQKKFLSTDYYKKSNVIFIYFHFDKEVKTDLIIKDCFENEKIVCLPYINWKNKILIPSQINSFMEIDLNKKIPVPKFLKPVKIKLIDLIIVPGVAFDVYKNRIGMGGGFYDRYLKKVSSKTKKISLSFEFQILNEKLPVDENDIKVDLIITEKRIID